MTLNNIINLYYTMGELTDKKMKASLAFKITRIIKTLEPEIQNFEEQKNKVLTEHCEEGKEFFTDGVINAKKGEEEILAKELNDLIATEIELNFTKIKISELEELDFVTPELLLKLDDIIEE